MEVKKRWKPHGMLLKGKMVKSKSEVFWILHVDMDTGGDSALG